VKKVGDGFSRTTFKEVEVSYLTPFFVVPSTNWDDARSLVDNNIFDNFDPDLDELVFTRAIPNYPLSMDNEGFRATPARKSR